MHQKIAPGKASTPVGTFPGIEPRKRRVFLLPRMPTASCGPFFPLRKAWKPERAWHRPGTSMHEWMRSFRAFPPPLRWILSRGHATFLHPSTTEERRKKPRWLQPRRSVTAAHMRQYRTTGRRTWLARLPHPHIIGCRSDTLPIRRPRHGADDILVFPIGEEMLPCGCLPDLHSRIPGA